MAEPSRRFPSPWRADPMPGGYFVLDANGQALAYLYSRDNDAEARQAKVLTKDEARRIAINVARLPELVGKAERERPLVQPSDYWLLAACGLTPAPTVVHLWCLGLDDRHDFHGHGIDDDDFFANQEVVVAAPRGFDHDDARGDWSKAYGPWDAGTDPHVEINTLHPRRRTFLYNHVMDSRALLGGDVDIGSTARCSLAGGAILSLIHPARLIGPMLLAESVLVFLTARRRLARGLIAIAVLFEALLSLVLPVAFLALLRLITAVAITILELPLIGGFSTPSILLSLPAAFAIAILNLSLARGFASALLRRPALISRNLVVSWRSLTPLHAARRCAMFLLRVTGVARCEDTDGCRGDKKLVSVHQKTPQLLAFHWNQR
jgi:hypothetical protein